MGEELYRSWGRAIRSAREAHDWTQSALAERLSVRPSSVCRWESGKSAPSDGHKIQVAALLGVDVHALFALTDEPQGDLR